MSFLDDLMAQGAGLLDRANTPPQGTETVAVKHDIYDAEEWRETLTASPALRDTLENLGQTFDYVEDLGEGVFDYFLKADPEIRDAAEMLDSRKPNQHITMQSKDTPQAEQLRQYTKGDPFTAAMAVTGISDKLRAYLQEHKDLADAAKDAQEKREQSDAAQQGLMDALGDAAGAGDEYGQSGGQGPLTQAQADAAAQLQAAIEAMQAAQQAQQQAAEALDTAMGQAAPASRTAVRQGIAEATQEAADQQAAMAACGVDPGEVKFMPFEQRQQLAQVLNNTDLRRVAWLIGRFRMEAKAEQARRVEGQREIFTEVELGRDLSRVLGSELAKFAGPEELQLDTLRRYQEGKLLQKRFEGKERQGKGPMVVVVDTSGSMGCDIGGTEIDDETAQMIPTREAWAKAITFVLLDSARRQKREFYAILFSSSTQQRHYHFPINGEPYITQGGKRQTVKSPLPSQPELGVVIDLITFMFNGGTDFEQPLKQAIDVIESHFDTDGKPKADVAMITDDDCSVSPAFMKEYQRVKAKVGFRTFGFAVGYSHEDSTLESLSDSCRTLADLAHTDEVRDVIRAA